MQRILYIVLFSLLALNPCGAQTAEEAYRRADSLRLHGKYAEAREIYRRIMYFDRGMWRDSARTGAAACHFRLGAYHAAAMMYADAAALERDDSLKNEWYFREVQALIYDRKLAEAGHVLQQVHTAHAAFRERALYYRGILAFVGGQYDSSKQAFLQLAGQDTAKRTAIEQLFEKNRKAGRINPRTARLMSIFIPGSGQFYTGEWKEGINSLLLNVGLLFLTYTTADRYTVFNALISVAPWLYRYYRGGANRAYELARNKKARIRSEVYRGLNGLFLEGG